MRYTIGKKTEGGALVLVKVWRGETLTQAAENEGCTVVHDEKVFPTKREARKALRAMQKALNPGQTQWYNPATDQLIEDVGKLHPGDGHTIKVSVKDQGEGPRVLVQRSRLLSGNVLNAGSLGRLPPGAARRLGKLLVTAADKAESVDNPGLVDSMVGPVSATG
jgi:hypothetical protein